MNKCEAAAGKQQECSGESRSILRPAGRFRTAVVAVHGASGLRCAGNGGSRPPPQETTWQQPRKTRRSRPISRVLSWTVIPLGHASPHGSSNLPGRDAGNVIAPLFGLAPGGVCRALRRWPRRRCALTAPFHHHHARLATPFGCLLSVALSVGSRRPGVTWHLALWSPDFPRRGLLRAATAWPTPRRECSAVKLAAC